MRYGIDIAYSISEKELLRIETEILQTNKFEAIEFFYGKDVVDFEYSHFLGHIKRLSQVYNLEVIMHLPMYDLGIDSKRIRMAVLDEIKELCTFASQLNCSKVITHGGSMGNMSSNYLTDEEFKSMRDSRQLLVANMLKSICDIAKPLGLTVMLENMFSDFLVNTSSKDLIAIKTLTNRDNLKFNYDTGHGNLVTEKPSDFIKSIQKDLGHSHFHDNDGRFDYHHKAGTGNVRFREIISTLKDIEYKGIIIFETKNKTPDGIMDMYALITGIEKSLQP